MFLLSLSCWPNDLTDVGLHSGVRCYDPATTPYTAAKTESCLELIDTLQKTEDSSLLRCSRSVAADAARAFYRENTFFFSGLMIVTVSYSG